MCIDCLFTFGIGFTSVVLGSQEYIEKYGFTVEDTGSIITFQYLVCAITLPILGQISDIYGQRTTIMITGGVLTLGSHIFQLLLPDCIECWYSVIPIFNYGLSLAVYFVVMWGSVSFLVEPKYIGTAYGVLSCIQNLGCTIMPPLLGFIHDMSLKVDHGYFWTELALIVFSLISLMMKYKLYRWDMTYRDNLLQDKQPYQKFQQYLYNKL